MERKALELRVKTLEEATPPSPCPPSLLQQLQQLQERLRQVERDRQELEPQLKVLENKLDRCYFKDDVKIGELRRRMREAEVTGSNLAKQLEALEEEEAASESPDRQSPDGQSRAQTLHDLLRCREDGVEKLAQGLAALRASVMQYGTQRLLTLTDALSEQPTLLIRDNMSQHRRRMSRVAFRPVENTKGDRAGSSIRTYWANLGDIIESLARCHFPQSVSWDSLPPTVQASLTRFAPKAHRYVEDDFLAHILFAAWVWRILDE
jgi:hypothetical protein